MLIKESLICLTHLHSHLHTRTHTHLHETKPYTNKKPVHTPEPARPSGSGMEKTRNTQTPADGPPHDPPYRSNMSGCIKCSGNLDVNVTILFVFALLKLL